MTARHIVTMEFTYELSPGWNHDATMRDAESLGRSILRRAQNTEARDGVILTRLFVNGKPVTRQVEIGGDR